MANGEGEPPTAAGAAGTRYMVPSPDSTPSSVFPMRNPEGLRERKKRKTRESIANAAARLFTERGFEVVTVAEVARAAEVSEQTVFNYFPTKEDLVFDRDAEVEESLVRLVCELEP